MKLADNCRIDLPVLLETRLLVQANSGGGKSHCLRLLLEQTANSVQQLVIDPEGEFASLREKFDYVICAPSDGDAVATPATAATLARRLLELGVSAILNIYDLKAGQRQAFVRNFFEALVNAPKPLWHPVLVVLDEAHVFCPQAGKAESAAAVIDLATRGRKRGYCLAMATQRLSKLHKDAAAEMINKLIGRTGLGIDVKRAADELGFTGREEEKLLRQLMPGQFFCYGPALSQEVKRIAVGPVQTTHPKSGNRLLQAPPPPSTKIKAVLAQGLKDIPKAAAAEIASLQQAQAEITSLRTKLALAEKRGQEQGVPESEVRRRVDQAFKDGRTVTKNEGGSGQPTILGKLKALLKEAADVIAYDGADREPLPKPKLIDRRESTPGLEPGKTGLRSGAVRILKEMAARNPAGYSKAQVATLTGFTPTGGTFNTYLSDLRRGGYLEERQGLLFATAAGLEHLGQDIPKAATSHAEVMAMWQRALRAGAYRMLETIVEKPDGISRDDLAFHVGMEKSGGTFNTYLSDLRRNGLIFEDGGLARPADILKVRT